MLLLIGGKSHPAYNLLVPLGASSCLHAVPSRLAGSYDFFVNFKSPELTLSSAVVESITGRKQRDCSPIKAVQTQMDSDQTEPPPAR